MSENITYNEKLCFGIGFGLGALVSTFYWLYQFDDLMSRKRIDMDLIDSLTVKVNKKDGSSVHHTIPANKPVTFFI